MENAPTKETKPEDIGQKSAFTAEVDCDLSQRPKGERKPAFVNEFDYDKVSAKNMRAISEGCQDVICHDTMKMLLSLIKAAAEKGGKKVGPYKVFEKDMPSEYAKGFLEKREFKVDIIPPFSPVDGDFSFLLSLVFDSKSLKEIKDSYVLTVRW
jgi:hypothetical protein